MIRLFGSVKFFWALGSGAVEGGAVGRPGFLRPSASRCACASAAALSLASAAVFASASSSALALRIRSARRFLSATQSGISLNDKHPHARLVGQNLLNQRLWR